MPKFYLNEKQYFNFIAAVAVQHGCRLVDIDFQKQIINIDGDIQAAGNCAVELTHILGRKPGKIKLGSALDG